MIEFKLGPTVDRIRLPASTQPSRLQGDMRLQCLEEAPLCRKIRTMQPIVDEWVGQVGELEMLIHAQPKIEVAGRLELNAQAAAAIECRLPHHGSRIGDWPRGRVDEPCVTGLGRER